MPTRRLSWRDAWPTLQVGLALVACGLWYATGGAVWYRVTSVGLWPALLVVAMWPLQRMARGRWERLQGVHLWLGIFLLTAVVSTVVAYNRPVAVAKLGTVIGAAGLALALSHQRTRRQIYLSLAPLGLGLAALALYSLAGSDWDAQALKYPALAEAGRSLTGWIAWTPGHRITPNVAGSMLAALLPYGVALAGLAPSRWLGMRQPGPQAAIRGCWALAVALGVSALILTGSRGAWGGSLAMVAGWALWRWLGRLAPPGPAGYRRRLIGFGLMALAGGLAVVLGGYLVLVLTLPGAAALANRIDLITRSLSLAQDYAYTGVGLGQFPIPYSVYTLLIHVGYIVNPHNTLVGILVEQGVLGMAALILLWVSALRAFVRTRAHASPGLGIVLEASVASLMTMVVHGMVDSGLYGSRGLLIMLVPVGVIIACARHVESETAAAEGERSPEASRTRDRTAVPILAGLAVILLVLVATAGRPHTAWLANRGALEQTRQELALYDPERFAELSLDDARLRADLAEAERLLAAAARHPGHPSAPRRLAAIYLSRSQYPDALAVLKASWDAGSRDSTTRLLYGDALIAAGDPAGAAATVKGIRWAAERIEGQASSRYVPRGEWAQVAYAYEAVARLNGTGEADLGRINEARQRAGLAPLEALP